MTYLLALLLPPIAIFICGKPFQAIFNLFFYILGIVLFLLTFGAASILSILCIIHAFFVVYGHKQDKRTQKIIDALKDK